jgi:hypothetical protein
MKRFLLSNTKPILFWLTLTTALWCFLGKFGVGIVAALFFIVQFVF